MISVYRKELKYVLFQHEFAKLRPSLSALLSKDTHGGDFGYTVRSLYFDSVFDEEYYAAVDGLERKSKIRLRIYGQDSPVKLELKEKNGSDSHKSSLILSREEADMMQNCDYGFLSARPEKAAFKIYMQLIKGAYQPKTLVEYEREAYTYPAGDVRVTFDTGTRATASGWDIFSPNPPYTPLLPAGTGVMEVKYSGILPDFIKALIETDKSFSANSKYVQARQFYQIGGDI